MKRAEDSVKLAFCEPVPIPKCKNPVIDIGEISANTA